MSSEQTNIYIVEFTFVNSLIETSKMTVVCIPLYVVNILLNKMSAS